MSLSYALSITNLLSGLIFSFAQTEMQMVSVERTEEYSTCVPVEPQDGRRQVRREACFHQQLRAITLSQSSPAANRVIPLTVSFICLLVHINLG